MNADVGLAYNGVSWLLYGAIVFAWAGSLFLIPGFRRLGVRTIPTSFWGFVWFGFALNVIIRFPLLCWDSYVFGNMTGRLADAPAEALNFTLLLVLLFYGLMSLGYLLARVVMQRMGFLRIAVPAEHSPRAQVWLAGICSFAIVLSSGQLPIPEALITPLGIVGTFWIVPAVYACWERFRFGSNPATARWWLFLLPGVLRAVLSPYRENLLLPVLGIILAALFSGRRFKVGQITLVVFGLFFFSTILIKAYRQVIWEGATVSEAMDTAKAGFHLEKSYDSKWVDLSRRFHAFDSLLLTVRYVPEFIPHSHREILLSSIVRGVVPRVFLPGKIGSTRGMEFQETIWGMEGEKRDITAAAISPSLPGDLFEAHGTWLVLLGSVLWGGAVGLLEAWRTRLSAKAAAAVVAMFCFHMFGTTERDYGHLVATTVQYLVMMFLLTHALRTLFPPAIKPAPAGPRLRQRIIPR